MPAMSRKSSSSTPSASDTAFIGTIYVAGHEAYGAQTCQKCGQGWPWAVFKRKADGNRDVSEIIRVDRAKQSCYMRADRVIRGLWGSRRERMSEMAQLLMFQHDETICLRCLEPQTESFRWSMHRNEMASHDCRPLLLTAKLMSSNDTSNWRESRSRPKAPTPRSRPSSWAKRRICT